MIYAVIQGELVVQSLPSGNIMDLTGALTTPVKTFCDFDTKDGGNDMVYLGTAIITPNHHIHMAEGWMTASQVVDKGQGRVRRSTLERVYNLCLEGGGNILINTSPQRGVMIFTPAATMGYLFLPSSGSQQYSALSYPEDIQTQLGLRQDLNYGHAHFRVGAVVTLPNGTLIFDNVTGDMPQKKPRTLLLDQSPGANRLRQSVPHSMTTLNKTHNSGAPDQGSWEAAIEVTSEATSLRSLSSDAHGAQVHLTLEKSQPKSDTEQATRELESSSAIFTRNSHPQQNRHPDTTFPYYSTAGTQPGQGAAQEYRLTPHFTTDTHILILKGGVASWTPIGNVRRGATVIQSLPSENIGDVKGAQSAILEQVWFFKGGGDDIDIIQIGMTCIITRCKQGMTVFSNTSYTKFHEPFQHHTYNGEHTAPPKTN